MRPASVFSIIQLLNSRHSLAFLESLSKIRVLEVGQVRLHTLEGLDKIIGLEKLCIWAN